jgi:hypothetical protein
MRQKGRTNPLCRRRLAQKLESPNVVDHVRQSNEKLGPFPAYSPERKPPPQCCQLKKKARAGGAAGVGKKERDREKQSDVS